MRPSFIRTLLSGAFAPFYAGVLAISLPVLSAAASAPPDLRSGNGITVVKAEWLPGSERTVIVDIDTPLISPKAINGGVHQVWITLPAGYASGEAKRYPVLYLLHGGNGGNASKWAVGGGTAEWSTRDFDLITVMPDGGKAGWYTDWVDGSAGEQKWETFHIDQLIPWIDANLRTNPRKEGRAIAGLSMGGYGALHYAYRHPDLFSYVGSFSGAADVQESGTKLVVWQQSVANGFPGYGAFGPNESPSWAEHNPLKNPEKFAGLHVALYAGAGMHDFDILERTMGYSSYRLHEALDARNISNTFWMYGRPGGGTGCDGGHNFGCWNFALNDMLPKMMEVLSAASAEEGPSAGTPWWHHIIPWKEGLTSPSAGAFNISIPSITAKGGRAEVNWDGGGR